MSDSIAEANNAIRTAVDARHRRAEKAVCCRPSPPTLRKDSEKFRAVLDTIWEMHLSKTADYGTDDDALANIRSGAEIVGIEPWRACLVRIADKVTRLKTFCRTGQLQNESVLDSLHDLAAYAIIAAVVFREGTRNDR